MLFQRILRLLGLYIIAFAGIVLIPLATAAYYEFLVDPATHPQPHSTLAFFETFVIILAIGLACYLPTRDAKGRLFQKEVILLVVLIWFLTPFLSAFPYMLSGTFTDFGDAYFESASGITTTGATTMQAKAYDAEGKEVPIQLTHGIDRVTHYSFYGTITPVRDPQTHAVLYEGIEAVSKAILFWRSFVGWFGGGGIILLFIAILPSLGMSGKAMFQTEISGPIKSSVTPRVQEGAIHLWLIYTALTVAQIIILLLANNALGWLDAITISFGSVSTGGLSVRNQNIASYNSPEIEWIIIVFMFLGSVNFSLYYYLFRAKFYRLYNTELIVYTIMLFSACCLSSWYLVGEPKALMNGEVSGEYSVSEAIRYGFFQIISAQTTTGYTTANYDKWPLLVQAIMLLSMYLGGMSGSTAGGMKMIRFVLAFRIIIHKVEELFSPKRVRRLVVGGEEVSTEASSGVLCFICILISMSVLATLAFIIDDIDLETSFTLVGAMINNSGTAFRIAGPTESYAFLSDFSLIISSFLMLLGRLEFLSVLALFVPAFWKAR